MDGITPKVMKQIADMLAPKLYELYDVHLRSDTFPDVLKQTQIIPIYKRECDKKGRGNHIPLALQPVLSRVCEKRVKNRTLDS